MIEPSYLNDYRPIRDVQIEALNQALSDEVLRHARTRTRLLQLLQFCMAQPHIEPGDAARVVERIVEKRVEVERVVFVVKDVGPRHDRQHWNKASERTRIPASVSERTGLAAVITKPVVLRSGVTIEPERRAATRGDLVAVFNDSAWLALSEMVRRRPGFVTSADLNRLIFDGMAGASSLRGVISRLRQALVRGGGSASDVEASPIPNGGWRVQVVP